MNVAEFVKSRESALATFTSRLFTNQNVNCNNINNKNSLQNNKSVNNHNNNNNINNKICHTSHDLLPRYRRPSSANIPFSELKAERKRKGARKNNSMEHLFNQSFEEEYSEYLYSNNKTSNVNTNNHNKSKECEKNEEQSTKLKSQSHSALPISRDEARRIRKRKRQWLMRRRSVAQRRRCKRKTEMLTGKVQPLCRCVQQSTVTNKYHEAKVNKVVIDRSSNNNDVRGENNTDIAHESQLEEVRRNDFEVQYKEFDNKQCEQEYWETRLEEQPQHLSEEEECEEEEEWEYEEEDKEEEALRLPSHQHLCSRFHMAHYYLSLPAISVHKQPSSIVPSSLSKTTTTTTTTTTTSNVITLNKNETKSCNTVNVNKESLSNGDLSEEYKCVPHQNKSTHVLNRERISDKHWHEWEYQEQYKLQHCQVTLMIGVLSKRKMHRCMERWASLLTPSEAKPHSRSRYYRARMKRIMDRGSNSNNNNNNNNNNSNNSSNNSMTSNSLRRPPASLLADLSQHCIYSVECTNYSKSEEYLYTHAEAIVKLLDINISEDQTNWKEGEYCNRGFAHFTTTTLNKEQQHEHKQEELSEEHLNIMMHEPCNMKEKGKYVEKSVMVLHGHIKANNWPTSICKESNVIDNIVNKRDNTCSIVKSEQYSNMSAAVHVMPVTLLLFPFNKHVIQHTSSVAEFVDTVDEKSEIKAVVCANRFFLICPLPIHVTPCMSTNFVFTLISMWTPCSASQCVASLYEWWCGLHACSITSNNNSNNSNNNNNTISNVTSEKKGQDDTRLVYTLIIKRVLRACDIAMERVHSQVNRSVDDKNRPIHKTSKSTSGKAENRESNNEEKTTERKKKKRSNALALQTPMAWIVFPTFAWHQDDNKNNNKCNKNILSRCVWQVLCLSGAMLHEITEALDNVVWLDLDVEKSRHIEHTKSKVETTLLHSNWNNRKLKQWHFRVARVLFAELVRSRYTSQIANTICQVQSNKQMEELQEELEEQQSVKDTKQKTHKGRLQERICPDNLTLYRCGVRTIGVLERADLFHQFGQPAFPLDYGGADAFRVKEHDEENTKECKLSTLIARRSKSKETETKYDKLIFSRTLHCSGTVANASQRVLIRASRFRLSFANSHSNVPKKEEIEAVNRRQTSEYAFVDNVNNKNNNNNSTTTKNCKRWCDTNNFIFERRASQTSLHHSQARRGAILLAIKFYETQKHHDIYNYEIESEPILEVFRIGVLTSTPFFMRRVGCEVGLVWCCFRHSLCTEDNKVNATMPILWCLCSPQHASRLEHLSSNSFSHTSTEHEQQEQHVNIPDNEEHDGRPVKRSKTFANSATDGFCCNNDNNDDSNNNNNVFNDINCNTKCNTINKNEVSRSQELLRSLLCDDKFCNIV